MGEANLNCDKTRSIVVWVFGCAMLGFLVACANTNARQAFKPTAQAGSGEEYVIGPSDLVRVSVWKHPDLSVEMPVRRDGKISVPLLDDVQAAGLTPTQLKAQITRGLTGNISNPSVTVAVLSTDSQTVTVIGGVTQSGPIPLRRDMGVLEAVAAAGGFTRMGEQGRHRRRAMGGRPSRLLQLQLSRLPVVPPLH